METLCTVLNNTGYTYLRAADYDQAIKTYQELADLAQGTGFARMLSTAYAGLADAYLATGAQEKALELAQAAKREAKAGGTAPEKGISRNVLGKVWLAVDQPAQAKVCFEEAIPLLEEAQEEDDLAQARAGLTAALAHLTEEASAQESPIGQNSGTTTAGI